MRIRTQIILPFLLLMIILGIVGTYLATSLVASSLERRIGDQLVMSEDAALNEAVRVQGQQLAGIRLIANTEGVGAAVASSNAAVLKQLIVPLEVNNRLGGIKVFDAQGRTILEVDQPDPSNPSGLVFASGTDLSHDAIVRPVLAGAYDALGDKYLGFSGAPVTALAATGPVLNGDRVVGGVMILTPLSTLLGDMRSHSQAAVGLFDRGGHVLGSTLTGIRTLDDHTRAFLDLASPGRAQRSTVQVAGQAYEIQYTNFYLRQRPVGYLAVGLSRAAVISAGLQSALQMTILFAAVVLLLLVIGYLLALRLTAPIEALVAGTRAVARGDLSRRITLQRGDELGELATAFNLMSSELEERTRSLNEQMRRLAVLYQSSQGIGRESGHGAIAEAILTVALKALGLDQAVLVSRGTESQVLEVGAAVGFAAPAVGRLRRLTPAELDEGLELTPGAPPERVANLPDEARPVLRLVGELGGLEQAILVPLVRGDRNAGYLLAGVPTGRNLAAADLELLETIGTEMALTLENAELKKTTELQAHRLDQAIVALEKISQALTAVTVGTDTLLRAVARAASEILEVPYASIHLRKPEWRKHFPDVIVGCSTRRELAGVRLSGQEVARRIDRPDQLLQLDLTAESATAGARRIGLIEAIGVPMALNGEIAGVLVVHLRAARRFARSETRVLQTLANQAVIAIDNAEAYETTRQLATTDSMTGVANHREFQARLDRELTRARRSREPMALLMCDVDHFKEINDTAGHPAGDAVLRYLTQHVLIPMVRPKDLVARYGGDEFVILLRGADGRAAAAIAERIRRAFADQPLEYEGRVLTNLSLSLGLATFPRDGETREALVQAADQALYVAKRSGRNRVARSDDALPPESLAG
ncbi:MAG TPA: diguanylate cyclase [Candidatus Limnocylindrales bacterium]|nr:diguanylate cyclase [Candidatus Limnocylindrales bacterium]